MLFKNILVPYDLSKCSLHAFKVALDVAKKYKSKVTVVTCLEGDPWHHKFYDSRVEDELLKNQRKAAEKNMEQLEIQAKKAKVSINLDILKTTSIVKQLVSFAKSRKIDLIIMGSHGRTGFDKLILGSVANGVTQKVSCPILLIK